MTPAALAAKLDPDEGFSTSSLAKHIRALARKLFPTDAPGKGGTWELSREQVAALKAEL